VGEGVLLLGARGVDERRALLSRKLAMLLIALSPRLGAAAGAAGAAESAAGGGVRGPEETHRFAVVRCRYGRARRHRRIVVGADMTGGRRCGFVMCAMRSSNFFVGGEPLLYFRATALT